MKKLYGYYGGSRGYGLPQTESSDWDYYAVGTSSKVTPYKIYPNVKIHQKKRTPGLDVEKVEICAYLTYLMNGFAFQVESLWVHKSFMDYLDPQFEDLILNQRNLLIDRCQLIENITCNIEQFRKKKVEDIQKLRNETYRRTKNPKLLAGVDNMLEQYKLYGFYNKDYIHGIRLAASLAYFLKHDVYPYKLEDFNKSAFGIISFLKKYPMNNQSKADLDKILDGYLQQIVTADLTEDEDKFRFDSSHAMKALKSFYP